MCCLLSIPCLYIWLNVLSPVDAIYQSAYRFSAYAIAISCILELTAETPVFVGQVFCFVKLKVVLDTLHIFIRSLVFIILVIKNKDYAIYAFGIAQFTSCLTIILGNYGFFHIYIKKLLNYRVILKKHDDDKAKTIAECGSYYESMHDFPFTSTKDMLPGMLKNPVSSPICFKKIFN